MEEMKRQILEIIDSIAEDHAMGRDIDRLNMSCCPDRAAVVALIRQLRSILLPGCCTQQSSHRRSEGIEEAMLQLSCQITQVLGDEALGLEKSLEFFRQLPRIRALVQTDLQAAFDGDPAASCKEEILLSYPGFFAVTVYRLAHGLQMLHLPLLPRMMTEHAHSVTGIDIHPGAKISDHFFIDHGTGIVIGETAVIGSGVKIYQGVTLGGLSTRGGQALRGCKRHPTIEDGVTIYANATILGGDTVIGRGCVIGANAFITGSVEPETTVYMEQQPLRYLFRREEK